MKSAFMGLGPATMMASTAGEESSARKAKYARAKNTRFLPGRCLLMDRCSYDASILKIESDVLACGLAFGLSVSPFHGPECTSAYYATLVCFVPRHSG